MMYVWIWLIVKTSFRLLQSEEKKHTLQHLRPFADVVVQYTMLNKSKIAI